MNTSLIGNTPMVDINGVLVKCEHLNPTGSGKDRAALEILRNCKHSAIIDVSSGNMGVSLAYVSQMLGKECIIYCPQDTSPIKVHMMKQFGATVRPCKNILVGFRYAQEHGWHYFTNQFSNPHNVKAQIKMAKEIKTVIAPYTIVTGIGTGGTHHALYKTFPGARILTPVAPIRIEGVNDGMTLPLMRDIPIYQYPITKEQLWDARAQLLKEGLYVGWSTAANYAVALAGGFKRVVIIAHDAGWRY